MSAGINGSTFPLIDSREEECVLPSTKSEKCTKFACRAVEAWPLRVDDTRFGLHGSREKKLQGFVPAGFDPNPSLVFGSSFRVGCEGQGPRPGQVRHPSGVDGVSELDLTYLRRMPPSSYNPLDDVPHSVRQNISQASPSYSIVTDSSNLDGQQQSQGVIYSRGHMGYIGE